VISKPLHEIGLDDVKALVGRVRESKILELKASLPPGKDGALKVLAGVSALANTSGGDFIIGVSETDGVAKAVDGIEPEGGVDTYKRTLQQILADRLEPHLPTLDLHQVECATGRPAPKSESVWRKRTALGTRGVRIPTFAVWPDILFAIR